jgi:hypothetical protein
MPGLREKLSAVKKVVKTVLKGAKAVHEEANYPGVPPSHKAADNPFHKVEAVKPVPEKPVLAKPEATQEDVPWYLKGEVADAGWDETNPGLEPGKKWEDT